MNIDSLTRILKDENASISQKMAALSALRQSGGKASSLIPLVRYCVHSNSTIAKWSQQLISELEYSSLNLLVDFILISKPTSEGQLLFQILYKLRRKDLHRYIITFLQQRRPSLPQQRTLFR